jgi:acid stress-induced BolA-like protein IbaG/YrbA
MRLCVIESPYRSFNDYDLQRNLAYARALLRHVALRGDSPLASHLDLTQALDDRDPVQREQGICAGLARLRVADIHAFGIDLGWSDGMVRARRESPPRCHMEQISLPEWAEAMRVFERDRGPMDALIAANQPLWHIHE